MALMRALARGPWDHKHTVRRSLPLVPWFNVVISAETSSYGFVLFGHQNAQRMQR